MSSRKAFARLTLLVLSALLVAAFTFSPAVAKPGQGGGGGTPTASDLLTVPVTGTFPDAVGGVGNFTGTFGVQAFTVDGGQLAAIGTLTGTLTDSLGNVVGTVTRSITLPVLDATGTCEILDLTLGPLDLDLLGLQVHLDQVHLVIEAESGPGNLLGNLLCAVAGLLDGGISLGIIADLLNVIVDLINELGL